MKYFFSRKMFHVVLVISSGQTKQLDMPTLFIDLRILFNLKIEICPCWQIFDPTLLYFLGYTDKIDKCLRKSSYE